MTLDELIMTRVSHDLAGICGALYNTAELLEIDGTFAVDAGPLIKSSAGALAARLKFFRALFGLDGAPLNNEIVNKYLKTLSAPFELNGIVENRMQLAGILICADMMIRGGQIEVDTKGVRGTGFVKLHEQLLSVFEGEMEEVEPKLAPAAWLYSYSKKNNCSVQVKTTSEKLEICF